MWVLIAVGVLLVVLFGVLLLVKVRRQGKQETDYRTFFILGITWMPLGAATKNPAFIIMGLAFVGLSLANKDKWNESHYSPSQKNLLYISLGLTLFLGALSFAYLAFLR